MWPLRGCFSRAAASGLRDTVLVLLNEPDPEPISDEFRAALETVLLIGPKPSTW